MVSALLERKSSGEFAESSQVIECKGKIEDFQRLTEILEADLRRFLDDSAPRKWRHAPVAISMRFGWAVSPPGSVTVTGRVATRITAICQRCLEPFEVDLDTELKLLLAAGDTPIESEDYEVWELDDTVVSPGELVEEALIMALPFSPRHESSEECGNWPESESPPDDDKVRPFADLKSMLRPVQD